MYNHENNELFVLLLRIQIIVSSKLWYFLNKTLETPTKKHIYPNVRPESDVLNPSNLKIKNKTSGKLLNNVEQVYV